MNTSPDIRRMREKIYKQFNNNLHMREKEYIKWKAQKVFRKNDVLIDLANKKANYSV